MMLYAHHSNFRSLYDGAPKLLLLAPQGEMLPHPWKNSGFRFLTLRIDGKQRLVLSDADGYATADIDAKLQPLSVPPTNVWAIWVPGSCDRNAGELLMKWWSQLAGEDAIPRLVHGNAATLTMDLLAYSLSAVAQLARSNANLRKDIAALRETLENHYRIPRDVEELLENLRLSPLRLAFSSPPPHGSIAVPAARPKNASNQVEDCILRQILPIGAHGLGGLDLEITSPGSGVGWITAELIAGAADAQLARWRVPFSMLRKGTLQLRLDKTLSQLHRLLQLRIYAEGAGEFPTLGICSAGLLPEYGLQSPVGLPAENEKQPMLAIRIWGGFPGVSTGVARTAQEAGLPLANPVAPVSEADMADTKLTREIKASYPCFGYLGDGRILLRPLPNQISAAVTTLSTPDTIYAVSCTVSVDDNRCRTQQLAARIVLTPPGISVDDAERGRGILAASEWVELADPTDVGVLEARMAEPRQGPFDLHLFTRLPAGGAIQHVRMVFGAFETELDPASLNSMPPVLPGADDGAACLEAKMGVVEG
ncbi:hypothetical protein GR183_03835 [Stappia sp. GBMRC 2046]|uniref:Uncharacterized protein n=1 Tax=Stappia sediminis TaxID=2692190 RepID=A0A7X3LS20_9HYPH|nr:DUF6212 domain-containing protein [Stappia sediminis]MXN64026.1 hypothetical protein [Stappia sediminis]